MWPTLLRSSQPLAAATRYREYIELFPQGERLADAHLNVIDSDFAKAATYQDAIACGGARRERLCGNANRG
ncbi:MAG: hypothetical protein WKF84_08770 [Pyrinomonadaceae bacterium]